ncbi:unnamed protein product [Mytilus coruscus]|uniref:Uncharacterized protein n=1 Tax=Mytilus coruscus TaxID=42192 RepID=A0A6J8EM67_MYTCO|nr:unnamed protein product [Mytilus coruscus]
MFRRGTRKRTASSRAREVRTRVTSHGSSRVKSTLTDSRIGRASASISTGHVTASTSRRLTPSLSQTPSKVLPENTVHIPDMSSVASLWQSVPQSTIVSTLQHSLVGGYQGISSSSASQNVGPQTAYLQPQFVAQTGNVPINDYLHIPDRVISVNENLGINVSQSIREKIIKGEYIDLANLLNNSVNSSSAKTKVNMGEGGNGIATDITTIKNFKC